LGSKTLPEGYEGKPHNTKIENPILLRIIALFQAAVDPPPGSGGKYILINSATDLSLSLVNLGIELGIVLASFRSDILI
jgi:hypothetical protein